MNTTTTNTQNAKDSYGEVKAVREEELESLAESSPVETVVRVVEKLFQPHILLTHLDGTKYWRPFSWEPIELVRQFHKFELEGERLFQEKQRSPEELEKLRTIMNSTTVVCQFYGMDDEAFKNFINAAICLFAEEWYTKDHDGVKPDPNDEHALDGYHNLVATYIRIYCNTMKAAFETTAASAEALKKGEE